MARPLPFRAALVILCLALGAACVASDEPGPSEAASISGTALAGRLGGEDAPVVLDVRSPDEFAAGHVPGAINIPHDQLAARLDELPAAAGEEVVVHCQRGGRASKAEAVLRDAGYENVRDLDGHWEAWEAAGLPVAQ
jgi:rhodanese-related sulfurtransferase